MNKLIEIKAYPLSKEEPYGSQGGFDIRRLALKHVCVLGKSQLPGNTGQPHRADVHTLIKMIRCGKLAKNDKKDL